MTTRYSVNVDDRGEGYAVVTEAGEVVTYDSGDHIFPKVLAAIYQGATLDEILDIEDEVDTTPDITPLTESGRVTIDENTDIIYLDDEPAPQSLANTIVRYRNEGRPFKGLARFLERLSANPSRRSREQLFDWTTRQDLEIDGEGYLIGYKGVDVDHNSVNKGGSAYVDDVLHQGAIPNRVGSVISMPRDQVQDDPTVTCSHGLHVGNYDYASNFGSVLLTVRVDPADVVSVPTDYNGHKMRCCRYEVVDVVVPDEGIVDYEPTAWEPDEETMELLQEVIPPTFFDKLKNKVRRGLKNI